jgi:hypothetical protein
MVESASSVHTTVILSPGSAKIGLISRDLSNWLFVPPSQLGGSISWSCYSNSDISRSLLHSLQKTLGVHFRCGSAAWETSLATDPVEFLVFDGSCRPPRQSHQLWETPSPLECIISLHAVRGKLAEGWNVMSRHTSHSELGGITNWEGRYYVYRRRQMLTHLPFWNSNAFSSVPGRFVDLIVDVGLSGCPSPPPDSSEELLLQGNNFDLSSWKTTLGKKRLKLPSRFAPTGYCRRKLAPSEMLSLFDVPGTLIKQLSPSHCSELALLLPTPLKILMPLARCLGLCLQQRVRIGGGKDEIGVNKEEINKEEVEVESNRTLKRKLVDREFEPNGTKLESNRTKRTRVLASANGRPPPVKGKAPDTGRTPSSSTKNNKERSASVKPNSGDEDSDTTSTSSKRGRIEQTDIPEKRRRLRTVEVSPRQQYKALFNRKKSDHLSAKEKQKLVNLLPRLAYNRFRNYKPPSQPGAAKAAKADDAAVPVYLWNDRVAFICGRRHLTAAELNAANVIRNAMHRRWVRSVSNSWWLWWGKWKGDIVQAEPLHWHHILAAGAEAVKHAGSSDFWTWKRGSGPFFWRWPPEYVRDLALGIPPMWVGKPPSKLEPQGGLGNPATRAALADKLNKMRERGYITPLANILATMNYFAVPKADDWRPVYDGTKSGLNAALWIPWFYLPDLTGLHRSLDPGYYQADNDYGEMFHNFWMCPSMRKYCGVDLTPLFGPKPDGQLLIEAWTRISMGSKPAPYIAVQQGRRLKRMMLGDRTDENNVFRWNHIEMNLPGSPQYAPARPWISKRRKTGEIAADAHDYVDDMRETGPEAEDAWQASSTVGKTCSFMGVQDATRKHRPPSQTPGAWAGAVITTDNDNVYDSVTKDKWLKAKLEIARLREAYDEGRANGSNQVLSKTLEQVAGYLNHIGRAYKIIRVYLNGLYATLNSWRPGRDEEGWRTGEPKVEYASDEVPLRVTIVDRLEDDILALELLTSFDDPPDLPARPSRIARPRYLFGDASGAGYGITESSPDSTNVVVDFGLWTPEITAETSSNQREFLNIVLAIEKMDDENQLTEATEFWIFTDNFHAEACFYKGGGCSKTRAVLDLMLRLQKIQMKGKAFIHIVWVSGKRMIQQGTDGLSRGDLTNGVMRGIPMLEFVPLHKTVLERQPKAAKDFLRYITAEEPLTYLSPEDWYTTALDSDGIFVWTPPPAVADAAITQLAESIHIRPWNTHIVLLPTLMTSRWRKVLSKACDLRLTLPFDDELWPSGIELEKLTLAICFPLLARDPWRVKRSGVFDNFQSQMRSMQGKSVSSHRSLLRELWISARALQSVPSGVARSLLSDRTEGSISPRT